MSRKLAQTVLSMTARRMRVVVATLAAIALGAGGAAAAVGSLNSATVSHETVQTQTQTLAAGQHDALEGATDTSTIVEPTGESDEKATEEVADPCVLPTFDDSTEATDDTADSTEATDDTADSTEATDDSTEEADDYSNHGAFVSSIARDKTLANHAEAVRWAAHSSCGKPLVSIDSDDSDDEATSDSEELTKPSTKVDHDKRRDADTKRDGARKHASQKRGGGHGR